MKIKSLLFGSAAASMVAVSGAQAADAIYIPEPEPMEYVRICDVYGVGFFYIPGTETCLRISGFARYQIGAENFNDDDDTGSYHYGIESDGITRAGAELDGWRKNVRARVNFDARSETEWGTLQGFVRVQGDNAGTTTSDFNAYWDQAYITLGGLLMGYTESAWAFSGPGATGGGSHSNTGMSYRYQQRTQIRYTYVSPAGFFGVASLEDDNLAGEGFMPDLVGKLGVAQDWGALWVQGAYDDSNESWAAKAGLTLNVPGMVGTSFRLQGYYSDEPGDAYGPLFDFGGLTSQNAEWAVLGSLGHQFTPEFFASVGYEYASGFDSYVADHAHLAELNLVWMPVTDFEIRTEIGYAKSENLDGTFSGFLRFQRNF